MKFTNQFFVTVYRFVNTILFRYEFGYKQPWFITKIATVLTRFGFTPWFGLTYNTEREIDIEEYEDPWTSDLFVHLVKLSDGQELPILCASVDEAWNRIEAWLFEKGDFSTGILEITKDEW